MLRAFFFFNSVNSFLIVCPQPYSVFLVVILLSDVKGPSTTESRMKGSLGGSVG